jgi:hypothetical protein
MNRLSANGGNKPCIRPNIGVGSCCIHERNVKLLLRVLTLLIVPTMTLGMLQNTTPAAIAAMTRKRLAILSHHLIRRAGQMTSVGRTPIYFGDICNG